MIGKRDWGIVEITTDDDRVRRLLHVLLDCYGLFGPVSIRPDQTGGYVFDSFCGILGVSAGQFFVNLFFILA